MAPELVGSHLPCSASYHSLDILIMTNKDKGNGKTAARRPALDHTIQAHIGRKLRAVYDEVAAAPVPDRIVELLTKLEESQRK